MDSHHAAYLAGIIDGEGHIGLPRSGARRPAKARLTVSTTTYSLVEWLLQNAGPVSVTFISRAAKNPKWNDAWMCTWTSNAMRREILEAILPFLIIKQRQAAAMLDWLSDRPGRGRPRQATCIRGHLRIPENLYPSGNCRLCQAEYQRVHYSSTGDRPRTRIRRH
jgi:hypothetical protein